MLTESAKKFMDALKNDPKAKELLKDIPKPETKEDATAAYIDLAGKLGITLSEEDVKGFVEEEKDVAARSENAAKAIQTLPDDELDNVAGGWSGAEGNCDNTYKQKENCWSNDACDIIVNHPAGYECSWCWD